MVLDKIVQDNQEIIVEISVQWDVSANRNLLSA